MAFYGVSRLLFLGICEYKALPSRQSFLSLRVSPHLIKTNPRHVFTKLHFIYPSIHPLVDIWGHLSCFCLLPVVALLIKYFRYAERSSKNKIMNIPGQPLDRRHCILTWRPYLPSLSSGVVLSPPLVLSIPAGVQLLYRKEYMVSSCTFFEFCRNSIIWYMQQCAFPTQHDLSEIPPCWRMWL